MTARAGTTALVTGATGQDGVYLCRLLRTHGVRVVGTVNPANGPNCRAAAYLSDVELATVDIRDAAAMRSLVADVAPDEVYHLAAFTSVGQSWGAEEEALAVNHRAVVDLLDAVMSVGKARFFQASSAELIGDAASSPYARAKQAAATAVHEARARGLHASTGILFNHESPLRSDAFVTRKITRTAAEIALGRTDHIDLGNLEVIRDWGFAGDFVVAMEAMLQLDEPADVQIGTGVAHSLADLLEVAFSAAGLSDPMSYVRQDPDLLRPADTSFSGADTSAAFELLDWRPTTTFEDVIAHMVR
ncbi:MAG TPA: GDP-mannose 4,6-dehydratase, partial [Nocardioides sp.]|nr:GDP-mannose 4,6-dehydratase [Nocardioides sp.]